MLDSRGKAGDNSKKETDQTETHNGQSLSGPPTISLPKGGGAIRGMGEKFAANPVTGTGSLSVPIATSPGRAGFGPQLSISYDSAAGNGPFGLGWRLSLPSITRKTDKGLPKYQDADESDVFIVSGAEDLVPVLVQTATNEWVREAIPPRTVNNVVYEIRSYRPRVEGLFARIERWTNRSDPKDTFWRSISKDNITTWYGKSEGSRIFNPADPSQVFSWLICESYDDKGNVIAYEYKAENSDDVSELQAHERNRTRNTRKANRYLKHIRYGNHAPYLPKLLADQPWPIVPAPDKWFFEVVFDYGEHHAVVPTPGAQVSQWKCRSDPFSSYRSGFDVRTYRLCERVLMFHHFEGEANIEKDCLVRSTDFSYSHEAEPNSIHSVLLSVSQSGYKRKGGGYSRKSLPPLEFKYTQPDLNETVREVDAESLENLPYGLDGSNYRWVDLDGEGLSGILTEQAEGWFYKRNLSPVNVVQENGKEHTEARFGPMELVNEQPSLANLHGGQQQLLDLAGDGQLDLVAFAGPAPGFYQRTHDGHWDTFKPFLSLPNVEWDEPNLKFIDLTGDGHADVLITEDDVFWWYPSLAEDGFGPAEQVQQNWDEELGPRLVFTNAEHSIYLADLSGDGLTDLVRIRNGEVCYWPNLGYGRFGTKVTMDNSPWFDNAELFNPQHLHLADIDGSGVTDIIYVGRNSVALYFNLAGNGWSAPRRLNQFPHIDNFSSVTVLDLLGNGTACLVWSSSLPGGAPRLIRYIDLMGGKKPHLLTRTINNLGAETEVSYAPSTKFYLRDKLAGKPWITKLPFPVHCVEKVTVTDKWRQTSFFSTYSYHHGYFDGVEREFRGFGRVEQVDVDSYGKFERGNRASPYITDDKTLYQPPVKTITWYHTGAFLDRERILSQFEHEYFPRWLEESHPGFKFAFQENRLPQPDVAAENLSAEEWREALRACKGIMLRQEVVELDIDALERAKNPEELPVKLFSTAYHNCHLRRLQPQAGNPHAVFLLAESEAITYHYELDIREDQLVQLRPDPRIAHTLNLQYDEFGNVLQSVAVAYPRVGRFENNAELADGLTAALSRIHQVQNEEIHLAYSESRYTEDFGVKPADKAAALDNHRLRLLCEVLTYELAGIKPASGLYFTIDELRAFQLSPVHQKSGKPVLEIPYQQIPNRISAEKRIVEHARTLFFAENLVDPLPFREHGRLGVIYESYKLALTETLLDAVFKDAAGNNKLDQIIDGALTARDKLDDLAVSGYLSGAKLITRFASIPAAGLSGQYWIRSGIAGFASDAPQHFYLPERYTDSFNHITRLEYDTRDLFVMSSTDAMSNTTSVVQFDFRVLAPREMKDINDNLSEVFFDVLGRPTALALKGKGTEGDNLTGFTDALGNPELAPLTTFFNAPVYDEAQARLWLDNAMVRHVYYFGETIKDGKTIWATHPGCACGIVRERHVAELGPGQDSPLQSAFEYSDGMGNVVVKKIQAEPESEDQPVRWVANGKTILNNKGKAVKQYEPYFASPEVGHRFEEPAEEGVTLVTYYDAAGRKVRTEMPDGSYSRVEFSPWHVRTFDQNDTVKEPGNSWFASHTSGAATVDDARAAKLASDHAGTPALTILDGLGRDVISIAHNRVKDAAGVLKDEKYVTFTRLDAEGKPLWIRDARGNLVMQYISPPAPNDQPSDPVAGFVPCYDIAGNLLFQHSMDASDRWMLNDAAGKPMLAWNSRGHTIRIDYDALHRPSGSFVKGGDPLEPNRVIQFEKMIYGDTAGNGLSDTPANDQTRKLNLRGKPYKHHDTAGIVISMGRNPATGIDESYDFKGNALRITRELVKDFKHTPDWSQNPPLETEVFTSSARFDALNRVIQLVAPHSDRAGAKLNIIRPGYNEATLLSRLDVWLKQDAEPATLLNPATAKLNAVTNIDYDAKGQRLRIDYNEAGHPLTTEYTYDKTTFRLIHLVTTRPKHSEAGKRTLQDLSYTYDPAGNITGVRDAAQQPAFFDNSLVDPGNDYIYDALYRLVHAEGREHAAQNNVQRDAKRFESIVAIPFPNSPEALQRYVETYEYDSVGNILTMQHTGGGAERWVRRYQYALDSNRLLATRVPGDPNKLPTYTAAAGYTAKYSHDAHGNMTAMPHLPLMEWDFNDQLRASQQQVVNNGAGEKTYYVYDLSGERVRKVTETQNTQLKDERIYLGGFEVFRKYENNGQTVTLERESLHIMDDKQRIALIETRTRVVGVDPGPPELVRYQFGNHLGSATLELDDEAKVITYEEYHPYGTTAYEAARNNAETPKRYRYTGKERDEETGFTYHGARYYAPWLGRWTSSDPIGVKAGLNLFSYVSNSPINAIDPTGTDEVTDALNQQYLGIKPSSGPVYIDLSNKTPATRELERRAADPGDTLKGPPKKPAPQPAPKPAKRAPISDYDGPSVDVPSQSRDDEWEQRVALDERERRTKRQEENPNQADVVQYDSARVQKAFDPAKAGAVSAGTFGTVKVAGGKDSTARNVAAGAEFAFAYLTIVAAKGSATKNVGGPLPGIGATQWGARVYDSPGSLSSPGPASSTPATAVPVTVDPVVASGINQVEAFQNAVGRVRQRIAADPNLAWSRLSPREQEVVMSERYLMDAMYGKAFERLLWEELEPLGTFDYIANARGYPQSRADFADKPGVGYGLWYDSTTHADVPRHQTQRWYAPKTVFGGY